MQATFTFEASGVAQEAAEGWQQRLDGTGRRRELIQVSRAAAALRPYAADGSILGSTLSLFNKVPFFLSRQ